MPAQTKLTTETFVTLTSAEAVRPTPVNGWPPKNGPGSSNPGNRNRAKKSLTDSKGEHVQFGAHATPKTEWWRVTA